MLRKMLMLRGGGGGVKLIVPSANSYYNLVGTVDLREQGGYFNRGSGTGALYVDAPPSQQGGYFNRGSGTGALYVDAPPSQQGGYFNRQ